MKYYAIVSTSDSLKHWKYLKKIKKGARTLYFYTQAQIDAYFNKDKKQDGNKVGLKKVGAVKLKFKTTDDYYLKNENLTYKVNKYNPITKYNNILGTLSVFDKLKEKLVKKIKPVQKAINYVKNIIDPKRKERIAKEQISDVKKNGQDGDHKYLYRITVNGQYRYFYSEDEYQSYLKRSEYLKNEPDFMTDVKRSDFNYTNKQDLLCVNSNLGLSDDYLINCAECSVIYELRRRGYDVDSNGVDANDYDGKYNMTSRFAEISDNAVTHLIDTDSIAIKESGTDAEVYNSIKEKVYIRECKKVFDKMPNNSRGDFSCAWNEGGGHSMIWEKDSKGKVTIYDSQISGRGKVYTHSLNDLAKNSNFPEITRTDNLNFTKDVKKIFRNRPNDSLSSNTRKKVDNIKEMPGNEEIYIKPRRRH